jgi:DNA-binding transcriptional regulator PaaX
MFAAGNAYLSQTSNESHTLFNSMWISAALLQISVCCKMLQKILVPGETNPSKQIIYNLVNKLRTTGSLQDKKARQETRRADNRNWKILVLELKLTKKI